MDCSFLTERCTINAIMTITIIMLTVWRRLLVEKLILSHSDSLHFKETEDFFSCSQGPNICPYLSQTNPVHTLRLISLRLIVILFSSLRKGIPSGILPSTLSAKSLHALPFPRTCVTCPAYYVFLRFVTLISGEEYKPWSSSFHCVSPDRVSLQPPVVSSVLDPNIFLSTLYSDTISLCSSFDVGDHV